MRKGRSTETEPESQKGHKEGDKTEPPAAAWVEWPLRNLRDRTWEGQLDLEVEGTILDAGWEQMLGAPLPSAVGGQRDSVGPRVTAHVPVLTAGGEQHYPTPQTRCAWDMHLCPLSCHPLVTFSSTSMAWDGGSPSWKPLMVQEQAT